MDAAPAPLSLFRGRARRSLDAKHRCLAPPAIRDVLQARASMGAGHGDEAGAGQVVCMLTCYDGCLVGFPLDAWRAFEGSMASLASASRKLRDFRRLVIGSAEAMVLDGQGRFRLSEPHLAYAGIVKEVEFVGQLETFEIWSPERLDAALRQDFSDVAAELVERGVDVPL